MLSRIPYSVKNKLLIPVGLILLLLCWNLAVKNTYRAVSLNKQLKRSTSEIQDLSGNPYFLKRKAAALTQVLSQYRVDSSDWQNEFWLKVSGIAASGGLQVIYQPDNNLSSSDTIEAALQQTIRFKGEFKELVCLLDSLEHSKGTGKLISACFEKDKTGPSGQENRLILLTTDFRAIPKEDE